MKRKQVKIALAILAIVAIVFAGAILLRPEFEDQVARYPDVLLGDYIEKGYYKMNSELILDALSQGRTDVFVPIVAMPETNTYFSPFSWSQANYLAIANALHQRVWKENTETWNIYSMAFYGDCKYVPDGFDIVSLTYFKAIGMQQYTAHKIDIYPMLGVVDWGGGTNYPRSLFRPWKSVDPRKLRVTADNALQMAEDHGGKQARLVIENACRVNMLLGDTGWHVRYSNKNAQSIFQMTIDPYTGKYVILLPGK